MVTSNPGRYPSGRFGQYQSWAILALAIWLFISPWVLRFAVIPGGAGASIAAASWNAWILGILFAIVGVASIATSAIWQIWASLVLAIWVFIAPWVLTFSGNNGASWDHWIVAVLAAIVASTSLAAGRSMRVDLAHAGNRPNEPPYH